MLNIFKTTSKIEQPAFPQNKIINDNLLVKQFHGLNIEIHGTYEEPLFKAKDIGDLLGIKNIRDTISNLDDYCKIKCNVGNTDVGNMSNTWFLTEDGLYELLFISRKPIAKQFKIWIRSIIKEIRLRGKYNLQEQLKQKEIQYQQQLEETKRELQRYKEKTYEEIEKTGHIYVIRTDGGIKVGKTKDAVIKRIKGMQTANVNNIEILLDYETSNADLLEKNIHYILDRYRCNSNREFFDCNVEYIKMVVSICGKTIDTLKSTYQHISEEDLLSKFSESGLEFEVNDEENDEPPNYYYNDSVNFHNWLEENIEYKENKLINLRDICELISRDLNIKMNNNKKGKIKIEIQRWIKNKFPKLNHLLQDSSYNNKKYKGWLHLNFRENTV